MNLSKNINGNKIRVAYHLQRGGGESLTYVKMYNFCSFEILVCYLILKES